MTFTIETYVFAFLMLVFAGFFLVVSYREQKFLKFITGMIGVTFFCLAIFGVFVGLASSVNYSSTAPCENVVNSSEDTYIYGENYTDLEHWSHLTPPPECNNPTSTECINIFHIETTYTYVDSCADISTPKSIEMLYVAYNYLLLFIIFVAVFSLMFIGLTKVILKW